MAVQRVADMTLEELNEIIEEVVDRRLQLLGKPQTEDKRSRAEVLASIKKHRIILPQGAKSSLEILREERDARNRL